MDEEMLDLRCPVSPSKMFARMRSGMVVDGNLVEIACPECARRYRKGGDNVSRVLHRYNVLGDCIETEIVRS